MGTFAIGAGEFGSNGIIQLFASDLDVSVPVATYAITAYAFGVVIGSPAITLLAARVNRRTLLLGLMGLFLVGNGLSALAPDITLFVVFRFVAGSVQGAFFGAGALRPGDLVHRVGRLRPHHRGSAPVRHDRRPGEAGARSGSRLNSPTRPALRQEPLLVRCDGGIT
ncbi:MFS transporter [Streptomyces sp. NPDC058086]|uniref:MFS transporter n=1 Tax=Streptomyces sp. NPDC058086 TaxID=3346334 RepID=UPI0036ED73C8